MKEIVQNEPAAFIFEKAEKPSKSFITKEILRKMNQDYAADANKNLLK